MSAHFSSLFDPKAKKWVQGRKDLFERLKTAIPPGERIIWMHCASLGEFEQGRPVMEKIRSLYPGYRILLTFFSPSGYEVQKNYNGADWVFYLPMDGPRTAKRFLTIVHPVLVIFVKYEFWYHFLHRTFKEKIPLILISALFRKDAVFFKWYGGFHRRILTYFSHIFLQNESSRELLQQIGPGSRCSIAGDTRFDRVADIAEKAGKIPVIEQFLGDSRSIIAGSTWIEDEQMLQQAMKVLDDPLLKLVIAPHEIHEKHLTELEKLFPSAIRFSKLAASWQKDAEGDTPASIRPGPDPSVLIIDNIGMLSGLYHYAYITYVGGGFRKALHNILEAAVYYKPVIFGPHIQKFPEALDLLRSGGGLTYKSNTELAEILSTLLNNNEDYKARCIAAGDFIQSNRGATKKIMDYIQENRLLTN